MDTLIKLRSVVLSPIKEGEMLASYTSFKIGGPAKYFCIANSNDDIAKLVAMSTKLKLPYLILGSGTNILFSDAGFDGLVIKINDSKIKNKDEKLECSAGSLLSKAVGEALGSSLSGLEWAMGIPGTVGGALCNNAGAYGGDMAGSVEEVEIIRDNKVKKLSNKKCEFSYRSSVFKQDDNHDIILSVTFALKRGDKKAIKTKMDEIIAQRNQKDDKQPSAGSVFKNIKLSKEEIKEFAVKYPDMPESFTTYSTIPAAWLIERCGLKGKKIGGAMISEKHSGRIINTGDATAEDIIMLISIIKQKVRLKFNLQLMEEIQYRGF
ncbi:UDP-N-acetylmuramate dehydrogenase [Candidatus Falkowbacteria bacterium]|uniref:UDP-N-acetylenolpyruvoylglucosamine reductase n=1 Tax=Candidatus Buchananbacteria bacterium CG10_big_fil_rev_8_21_14_0_10_33_19 TaxID=1974525 RepID=A0A2H0W466_9BACT|nr:UDP-N-acetylmuramate dehydrogenase [Candidatus Falkowbacteria bacterium]PIS06159.1 MAG: UDP-N-acetylenolpyruvoylglucosamine reductase [Candidatus Buchananbacteria bacterium CG10_big_fil_rev_8_21_14_0_10_33_19]